MISYDQKLIFIGMENTLLQAHKGYKAIINEVLT